MVNYGLIIGRLARSFIVSLNPRWVKPRDICICITHRCNSRCITCNVWRTFKPEPSLETLKNWISQFADYGIKGVSLSGGEPFLREDLCQIVDYAHEYDLYCGIGTNGSLVGKVSMPDVDSATVSIDGAKPETHDHIRGVKGSWIKAWNAIDTFIQHGIEPAVNFVMQSSNYTELPELCRIAIKHHVKRVNLLPVNLGGFSQAERESENRLRRFDLVLLKKSLFEAYETGVLMNSEEFLKLIIRKIRGEKIRFRCVLQSIRYLVSSDGNVYLCSVYSHPIGNLYKQSFREIVEGEAAWKIRDLCLKGECPYWDVCLSQELDSCIKEHFGNYFLYILKRAKMRLLA